MNNFVNILINEIKSVIEGLIGLAPEVSFKEEKQIIDIEPPYAKIELTADQGEAAVIIPPELATALGDLMLAGEGEAKSEMNEDDLDAIKEIVSNVFGSLSTTLEAQEDLPKLKFQIKNVIFIQEKEQLNYADDIVLECSIKEQKKDCHILLDNNLYSLISGGLLPASNETMHKESKELPEVKNLEMLLDIKLQLRVRIGTKVMLLKDVVSMDIGSIIELNQLANEPLEILIDDKKIGEGEVVIVDGNFGIQITSIGTKEERLNTLKK
ncbi:flagellar motor switch protein FliN/FliY [Lebetimonas natsushimae]|uniref:Flagellar motor switch protein FliN n=1 Tax=Lebetimonas natsushimae TaxID=1936991 RepID=A0A292YG80_9BACT|nr:flagellar motor switch protein FliY [Lebetimonas natsushimae]GAX87904.1 flagellar motor switch protein FliN/FliY [Lebetimonas natsushimae]